MALTEYTYTISTDFPNGKVNPDRLEVEVNDSAIATVLENIKTNATQCTVVFAAELSAPDKLTLDGNVSPPSTGSIIGSHSGEPFPHLTEWVLESTDPGSTNSVKYIVHSALKAPEMDAGDYLVHWAFTLGCATYTTPVKIRVVLDGVTVLYEDKNKYCALTYSKKGWTGSVDLSSFSRQALLFGDHTVTVEYATTSEASAAKLDTVRLEIVKLA